MTYFKCFIYKALVLVLCLGGFHDSQSADVSIMGNVNSAQTWKVEGQGKFSSPFPPSSSFPSKMMSISSQSKDTFIQQIGLIKFRNGELKISVVFAREKGPENFQEEFIDFAIGAGLTTKEEINGANFKFINNPGDKNSMMLFVDKTPDKVQSRAVFEMLSGKGFIPDYLVDFINTKIDTLASDSVQSGSAELKMAG